MLLKNKGKKVTVGAILTDKKKGLLYLYANHSLKLIISITSIDQKQTNRTHTRTMADAYGGREKYEFGIASGDTLLFSKQFLISSCHLTTSLCIYSVYTRTLYLHCLMYELEKSMS